MRPIESVSMVVTSDIDRYAGKVVPVTYAEFADPAVASVTSKFGKVLVVGRGIADALGADLGDTVAIIPTGAGDQRALYRIAGIDETTVGFGMWARPCETVYTPGLDEESPIFKPVGVLEVSIGDSHRADEYRTYAGRVIRESGVVMAMNTSRLEGIRNAHNLVGLLYPIALVATLLIGGFLCCLILLQSSKEAAIMRVLGTTKAEVRALLALEQIPLNIAGIAVGMCTLTILDGPSSLRAFWQTLLYAAMYFTVIIISAAVSAAIVTRRKTLALLNDIE